MPGRLRARGRGVLIYLREGTVGVPSGQRNDGTASSERAPGPTVARRRQRRADPGRSRDRPDHAARDRTLPYVGPSGFGIDIVATELLDG
jgi:3,4-dihydroxy 2-butanone 4-phosphate synthase/GTP cyclohydrolase II